MGTVEVILTEKDFVTLVLRGHTLAPLDARVKPGDMFAVSVIKEQGGTVDLSPWIESGLSRARTYDPARMREYLRGRDGAASRPGGAGLP